MSRRVPTINDLRVKLCYICREEERYDGTPPRPWTHPCTCTLIAHESCLLRWIQSSQSTRSRASNALKCPQCGTAYELTSSNPWLLRCLDMGNKGISMIGRVVSVGSLTVVVVSLGTGLYILSTAYGAYAVREFLGAEMFDILLTDDPSNWPWHSFINLPLIPFALIFSRLSFKSNITPLIPLLLAWPTSSPVAGSAVMRTDATSSTASLSFTGQFGKDLFPLVPHWPPPPFILGLFIYPIVREGYNRLFTQYARWVLDSKVGTNVVEHGQGQRGERDVQRVLMGAVAEDEPFLGIRINAQVDREAGPAPPGALPGRRADRDRAPRQPNNGDAANNANGDNDNDQDDNGVGDVAAAAENTIRVSGTSLGRLIGGALIIPRISSLMGSLLLWLSKHSVLLRTFLAVRPPLRASGRLGPLGLTSGTGAPLGMGMLGPRAVLGGDMLGDMGLLKKLGVAGMLGLSVAWRGTYAWNECDPVWWRNSVGLGLFTVAKDLVHLLHLYLAKRELESRRVKNRSFEGVDIRELDLIDPQAHA